MRAAASATVRDAPDARPGEIIAVGGTASNLLKILPAAALDRTLTRERIVEVEAILSSEPAAAAAERYVINPIRARILPAGGAIMDAILDRYGAERIRVSDAGLREGTILAVSHAGRAWRDRLAIWPTAGARNRSPQRPSVRAASQFVPRAARPLRSIPLPSRRSVLTRFPSRTASSVPIGSSLGPAPSPQEVEPGRCPAWPLANRTVRGVRTHPVLWSAIAGTPGRRHGRP